MLDLWEHGGKLYTFGHYLLVLVDCWWLIYAYYYCYDVPQGDAFEKETEVSHCIAAASTGM
jgi:hypothetical protein